MVWAAVLCALVVVAALGDSTVVDNCSKFCDLLPNGTLPPRELCYCFNGLVTHGKKALHKTYEQLEREDRLKKTQDKDKNKDDREKDKGKDKEGKDREERQAQSNSFVGSSLFLFQPLGPFTPPLPICVPSGDLGGFPEVFFSTESSFFSVRDQALCGDWFLVYDNGVLLGATSDPGCVTAQECIDRTALVGTACLSRACFLLAPNVSHNISVVIGYTPFPNQALGVDLAYYGDLPGADCSQSQLVGDNLSLNRCTPVPPTVGPSPCPPFGALPTPIGCPTFAVE